MSGATLMTPDRWIKFSIVTKVHLQHSDGKFFFCYQSKCYTDNFKFITSCYQIEKTTIFFPVSLVTELIKQHKKASLRNTTFGKLRQHFNKTWLSLIFLCSFLHSGQHLVLTHDPTRLSSTMSSCSIVLVNPLERSRLISPCL